MVKPVYHEAWPDDWKVLYKYDLWEVFGDNSNKVHTCMFKLRHRKTLDLVRRHCDHGARVLDVGAAQGNFTLPMAEAGYVVTWNDILASRVGYVKLQYSAGEVSYRPGNLFELPFGKDFDCVLATEIVEHVAHPDEFVRKLAEFVRPGGKIIITTPNGAYVRNRLPRWSTYSDFDDAERRQFQPDADGHIFALHEDEVRSIAARLGIKVLEVCYVSNPMPSGSRYLRFLLRILPESVVLASDRVLRVHPWLQRRFGWTLVAALEV